MASLQPKADSTMPPRKSVNQGKPYELPVRYYNDNGKQAHYNPPAPESENTAALEVEEIAASTLERSAPQPTAPRDQAGVDVTIKEPHDAESEGDGDSREKRKGKGQNQIAWISTHTRHMLIFGFLRRIESSEHKVIAESFAPLTPTPKAIMEKITKLRGEEYCTLEKIGIWDSKKFDTVPDTEVPLGDDEGTDSDMEWSVAADNKLLSCGFGRQIDAEELQRISRLFGQHPSKNAIKKRMLVLQQESIAQLKKSNLDPESSGTTFHKPRKPARPSGKKRGRASFTKGKEKEKDEDDLSDGGDDNKRQHVGEISAGLYTLVTIETPASGAASQQQGKNHADPVLMDSEVSEARREEWPEERELRRREVLEAVAGAAAREATATSNSTALEASERVSAHQQAINNLLEARRALKRRRDREANPRWD